jgi:ornithine decarboxylase
MSDRNLDISALPGRVYAAPPRLDWRVQVAQSHVPRTSSPRLKRRFDRLALPGAALWAEPGPACACRGRSFDRGAVEHRLGADPPRRTAAVLRNNRLFVRPDLRGRRRHERPFVLPADAAEGDWIEIGELGAYGGCLGTAFNGFDRVRLVEVRDAPLVAAGGAVPAAALAA